MQQFIGGECGYIATRSTIRFYKLMVITSNHKPIKYELIEKYL